MGQKINLNLDWKFHLGDMLLGAPGMSPDFMGMDDSAFDHEMIDEEPSDGGDDE